MLNKLGFIQGDSLQSFQVPKTRNFPDIYLIGNKSSYNMSHDMCVVVLRMLIDYVEKTNLKVNEHVFFYPQKKNQHWNIYGLRKLDGQSYYGNGDGLYNRFDEIYDLISSLSKLMTGTEFASLAERIIYE